MAHTPTGLGLYTAVALFVVALFVIALFVIVHLHYIFATFVWLYVRRREYWSGFDSGELAGDAHTCAQASARVMHGGAVCLSYTAASPTGLHDYGSMQPRGSCCICGRIV